LEGWTDRFNLPAHLKVFMVVVVVVVVMGYQVFTILHLV
jgi:hypothetical protein